MKVELCLNISPVALSWTHLPFTEYVSESLQALVRLVSCTLGEEPFKGHEHVCMIAVSEDALHHEIQRIKDDHVSLEGIAEAT